AGLYLAFLYGTRGAFYNPTTGSGYVLPVEQNGLLGALGLIITQGIDLLRDRGLALSLLLAVVGAVGCVRFRSVWLHMLAIALSLVGCIAVFRWRLAARYVEFLVLFGLSVGVGSAVAAIRSAVPGGNRRMWQNGVIGLLGLSAGALFVAGRHSGPKGLFDVVEPAVYWRDASRLVHDARIPPGSRLLLDDDVAYCVVLQAPGRFRSLFPIQRFSVLGGASRDRILARTDLVDVSKGSHGYYYLNYLPIESWGTDPFRRILQELAAGAVGGTYEGRNLVVVENDSRALLVRVGPPAPGAS
ncbi:MAG: hypothetical protein ACRD16_07355, partial [Thermoanaerobaculia bacterium]